MLDGPRLAPLNGRSADALAVLVHGYGSNGDDLISLAAMIRPVLPSVAFVAPNAPSLLPNMADAHQWWPIDTFSAIERANGAAAATPELDRFLSAELRSHGLPDNRLLLVGFSQGAMMALYVGLRRARPPGGIIGIAGMLVAPEMLVTEIRVRPPVLLIHGTEDEVVPFQSLSLARDALTNAGVPVETHVSPGIAHSIGQDGLAAAAAFAARILA